MVDTLTKPVVGNDREFVKYCSGKDVKVEEHGWVLQDEERPCQEVLEEATNFWALPC